MAKYLLVSGRERNYVRIPEIGRNKSTAVNKTYISGGEYRSKFNRISDDAEVCRVLYQKAKEMLMHRSGTLYEDMYWIDGDNAEVIASILDPQTEKEILYGTSLLKKLYGHNNIIAMHTHPNSMPPSIADFNSIYEHGYDMGIIVCHDGKSLHTHRQTRSGRACSTY